LNDFFSIDFQKKVSETIHCKFTLSEIYGQNVTLFLETNNNIIQVPDAVVMPSGITEIYFDISISENHDDDLFQTSISASLQLSQNNKVLSDLSALLSKQYHIFISDSEKDYIHKILIPHNFMFYDYSTWDYHNWFEIDVFSKEKKIKNWSIEYTWEADWDPSETSFFVLSPSGTTVNIGSGQSNGNYTVTSSSFNGETVNGKWRLWIEDSYGIAIADNITMSIMFFDSSLYVTIPESVVEGKVSITGTVSANPAPEKDLIVYLYSNNSNRISVQSKTIIKAGNDRAIFSMSTIDDQFLNGHTAIQILASTPDYYTGSANIMIEDNDTGILSVNFPDSMNEGVTGQGIISIDRPLSYDLTIPLIANIQNIGIDPEIITIPAGITEVIFDFTISGFDIKQTIIIKPYVKNWTVSSDTVNITPAMIPESERQALLEFYNSTGGNNWSNRTNWKDERGTECSWYGISCDTDERYIIGIDLDENNLIGKILSSFSNLQGLSRLYLSGNQLAGLNESLINLKNLSVLALENSQLSSLPVGIIKLENLSFLNLEENQLTSLPENFGNLQNLSAVYLSDNQLTSLSESFGNLQNLSVLYLNNNQLTSLPDSFSNLQKIEYLNLDNNQLINLPEGFGKPFFIFEIYLSNNQLISLPESFGNINAIFELDLSNNQLISLPESFGNINAIFELDLSNNQLISLPESFGNINTIFELDLSNNQLKSLSESFGNISSIVELDLSNNQLINMPENFGSLHQLINLNLSSNHLNHLPQDFEKLTNIKKLDFSINYIKILPQGIGKLINLTYLDVSKNQIQNIPESISKCTPLSKLNLSYNLLKKIPSSIGNLKILKFLDISNNQIEEMPGLLKYLSNIQEVNLSHNKITTIPYQLSNINSLQKIDLSENSINEINEEIQGFTSLLTLNLSGNNLTNISSKIEKLVNLQSLDLSNCVLKHDNIPSELYNLNNLRYLSLSNNNIKKLPKIIYNLTNLISLNLEKNQLSGNIDESLCHLIKLQSLDLSDNKYANNTMQGDIPLEFSKLKNLTYLDLDGTNLYTTSPALEKLITDINPYWINSPPGKIERNDLCIHFITTTSDSLGYSLYAEIPILVVMTQPVKLLGGELVINFEIGETDRDIHVFPYTLSYTATAIYKVQKGDFSEDLNVNSIRLSDGASLTNEDGENVDLTLIPEINLAAMKNIYVDGTIPTIEITQPKNPCVEHLDKIKGTATDISKDFSVTLTILNQQNTPIFQDSINCFNNTTEIWEFAPPQSIWDYNASYTIQLHVKDFAGNTNTLTKNISYGKKQSTITTNLSKNYIILGQTNTIKGTISPPESLIGEEVTIKLVSPSGKELGRKVNAAENGSFEYPLQCNDLDQAGPWQIIASWDGTSCLDPAVSEATILTVAKASCEVALDATYNAIKRGHSITITGKVMPQFDCVENMFNIPVNLRIVNPESKTIEFTVFTSDKFGAFKEKDYTGFDELGTWTVQADVVNNAYKSAYSDLLKIQVVEEAGYAIIIQGKAAGGEGLASHNKTANNVYRNLKKRGLMDSDILYFNYDDHQQSFRITEQSLIDLSENDLPENITNQLKAILNVDFLTTDEFLDKLETIDSEIMAYSSTILEHSVDQIEVDGITQKDRIQKAITQDLPELMKGKQANIYMVLVDHGSPNKFHVYQDDDNSLETDHFITDVELNHWLNDFETN
jgi:Leucine-rich repeat (LRR) protein